MLTAASGHVEALLAQRAATGSMLHCHWPANACPPPTAADQAVFKLALAHATPCLGRPEVLATLRAVAAGRGAARAGWPGWAGLRAERTVVHGDFHPGNLLFAAEWIEPGLIGQPGDSGLGWADVAAVVLDFQHCGVGPAAAELLYFFVHARTMWNLPTSALPMLLTSYVVAASTIGEQGELTVPGLMEEMLAIAVQLPLCATVCSCQYPRHQRGEGDG